jgi:hypothetical protein
MPIGYFITVRFAAQKYNYFRVGKTRDCFWTTTGTTRDNIRTHQCLLLEIKNEKTVSKNRNRAADYDKKDNNNNICEKPYHKVFKIDAGAPSWFSHSMQFITQFSFTAFE